MKTKRQHFIILLVVAALLVVSVLYIYPPGKKTHLGLDLKGGLEVVYKASKPNGAAVTSQELAQAMDIMNRRVNGLGVTEAQVQKQQKDQISVALPGVTDTQRALQIIGKTAQLQFFDDGQSRVAGPSTSIADVIQQAKSQTKFTISAADLKALADPRLPQPSDYSLVTAPGSASSPGTYLGNKSDVYFIYKQPPQMTGDAIKTARQAFYSDSSPDVEMDFTTKGGKTFADVTKQLAFRGALQQVSQTFAIVLDNQMESDPEVNYKDNPNGISGGSAIIQGHFTIKEAQDLALVLNTGALPVRLDPIEQQQVSATLGKDSLKAGLIAGLVGFCLVLVYMVFYYRFLGLIADFALLIYAILLWGVFNFVPVTLSLPGIAGMILTIGVAADANVVIFERIKEEVRHGKTVRSSINSGYTRGFKTILDANVLTLLTAAVLFMFATAQPKGFALTLILGVLVSMFTAIAATRAMLGLLSDFVFFNKAAFMGVSAAQLARGEQEMAADRALFDASVRDGRERAGRRAARSAARADGGARPAVAEAVGGASVESADAAEPTPPQPPRQRPKPSRTSRGSAPRKKKRRR